MSSSSSTTSSSSSSSSPCSSTASCSSSSCRLLLLLLLSLSASFSCSSAAAQRDPKLRLLLHRTPLGSKQDVDSRAALAQLLLSDLLQEENEALLEGEAGDLDGEANDLHVNMERAAAAGPLLGPRERKAGCKNFFWKTFTSC